MPDLEAIRQEVKFAPGQEVFKEGDQAEEIFNLISGCIRIFKLIADGRRQIIGFVLPGEYFGMVTGRSYPCSAEAVVDSRTGRSRRSDLEALAERHPSLQRRMLHMAWAEVARMQEQMLVPGRKTPQERMATFLLTLAQRYEYLDEPHDSLHIPMSQSDIADYLGLTVETVGRNFSRLNNNGLIALPESSEVKIVDRPGLASLAELE